MVQVPLFSVFVPEGLTYRSAMGDEKFFDMFENILKWRLKHWKTGPKKKDV